MSDIQALFEIKKKFLSVVPHPKLIKSAIKRLYIVDVDLPTTELEGQPSELIHFLEFYIDRLMKIRLRIANATNEENLAKALIDLFALHHQLLQKLASYNTELSQLSDEELKISQSVDAYEILKFVKEEIGDENQIKTYLRSLKSEVKPEDWKPLEREVLRSAKILREGAKKDGRSI